MVMVMVIVIVMVMARATARPASPARLLHKRKVLLNVSGDEKRTGLPVLLVSSDVQSLFQLCQTFCTSSLSSSMSMSFSMFFTSPSPVRVM